MRTHPSLLAAALGAALVGPGLVLARSDSLPAPASPRSWSPRQTPVVEVVRRVRDAVVNIHSERTVRAPGAEELFALTPSQHRVNGMGTGIVLDPRGYIVTNQHVVEDVSLLRVRLGDGTTLSARVVARDIENDLALLKISPPRPLPVMPLGTSLDLQVGETVVAIGNAYGYDHTVTVGVVSATGRDVSLNKDVRYRSLIQTDASINPGNSGGPLVNLQGELVGVNVAIRAGAQGIGFAIPVDTMIRVCGALLQQIPSRSSAAPLGLTVKDVPADGASPPRRVLVQSAQLAALSAGLRPGDQLVKVGDVPVLSSLDLHRALLDRSPGSAVVLDVRRDGKPLRLRLVLPDAPAPADSPQRQPPAATLASAAASAVEQVWRQLGVKLYVPPSADTITRAFPQLHGGLLLGEVRPDSPASRAGLRQGDVLVGLHQWEMLSLDNVLYVLNHPQRASFEPLKFFILRGGQVHRGWLAVAE